MQTRPVWAEISLDRLRSNYRHLRHAASANGHAPELLAVVKANAYGHGVELCGPALAAAGARWLGVTCAEEGAALRRSLGVLPGQLSATRILIMSGFWPGEQDLLLERGLTPQVWESYHCTLLREVAAKKNLPAAKLPVHLEIDTGMSRQGAAPGEPLAALIREHFLPDSPLSVEGVLTHFSAPEQLDRPDTDAQIARFTAALAQLRAAGLRPQWLHAGNSATLFDKGHAAALQALATSYSAKWMMRPGLALYGYPARFCPAEPPPGELYSQSALKPVLAWKTRVTSLRSIASGDSAGYNSIFRALRPTRLALVPAGYADGLNRLLSTPVPTRASAMLVRGQRAPIAGRISMDQTMLDVTDIADVTIGEEAVILGQQGSESITAAEHADLCGTIPYEILCNISARVPRLAME